MYDLDAASCIEPRDQMKETTQQPVQTQKSTQGTKKNVRKRYQLNIMEKNGWCEFKHPLTMLTQFSFVQYHECAEK